METVAILGVGLIGGSFALALKRAGFSGRILGVSSPATLKQALDLGAIDEGLPIQDALARADLVFMAQPIGRILTDLPRVDMLASPGALITDVGSTKVRIVQRAKETIRRAKFLGGHPLAGSEARGVAAASADLFAGRTWFLTPVENADLTPASGFLNWIRKIGAVPTPISPSDHDRLVAHTSHLPQLAATALACALSRQLAGIDPTLAAGPGLLDSTRLAMSSFDVWGDIVATNQEQIERALAWYIQELQDIRRKLGYDTLRKEFEDASMYAKRLRKIKE